MRHYSCDLCGKDLTPETETRFVVRMETFPANNAPELTDQDLDQDHLDTMAEMLDELEDLEDLEETPPLQPICRTMEYDLCPNCFRRFQADPLGRERTRNPHFSKN